MAPTEGIPEVAAAAEIKKDAVAEQPKLDLPHLSEGEAAKVVKQVKHYFTDANLNHDNYMVKSLKEEDGWIKVTQLARFNRIRQLLGVPTDAPQQKKRGKQPRFVPVPEEFIQLLGKTIKEGLAGEETLEVKEDGSAIRRTVEFTPSGDWYERTVHFKGLDYGRENPDLIDELTDFFSAKGKVMLVRLRRNPKTKAFKGNVLVEFDTKEAAEEVSKLTDLEYKSKKLEPAMLSAYHDEKQAADEYIQPELQKPGAEYQSFEDYCKAHGREVPAIQGERKQKREEPKEVEVEIESLVKFSGVEGEVGFPQLKELFNTVGPVRFIDYERGSPEGIVRFRQPIAKEVVEKNAEGIMMDGLTLKLAEVDEEAHKAFVERAKTAVENSSARGGNDRKRRGNFSGGRGGKRGRH
ncbi:hypothetical protein DL89DRAFT_269273 [Linderina pennispora]|uniref:La-domain-containing protein n=1 Tax=Linderina pennispora TaxID=61395 RepID=A0A1Y1W1R7_9FUNG|nr:uncharacterized protein DL89DRAFT_269273 [Linderina pennispora]ORX67470.1 hypothetical protein DL89DRAFT_269273 [Linderina pennispora]